MSREPPREILDEALAAYVDGDLSRAERLARKYLDYDFFNAEANDLVNRCRLAAPRESPGLIAAAVALDQPAFAFAAPDPVVPARYVTRRPWSLRIALAIFAVQGALWGLLAVALGVVATAIPLTGDEWSILVFAGGMTFVNGAVIAALWRVTRGAWRLALVVQLANAGRALLALGRGEVVIVLVVLTLALASVPALLSLSDHPPIAE